MEDGAKVTLKVFRFNPDVDRMPRCSEYVVPWSEGLSLLEAIRYVHHALDASLCFHDYRCGRRLCQGCLLEVDGKTRTSCQYLLKEGGVYSVRPPEGYPVIRDLRVDFGVPVRAEPGGPLLWVRDGAKIEAAARAGQEEAE